MWHPLDKIPGGQLRRWQFPSLGVALVCVFSLPFILPGRETHTLIELVESGSSAAAASVLVHWSDQDRIRVAYAVDLDFVMNPAYMNVLAISAIWAGRQFERQAVRTLATLIAWLAWSVVATNVVENIGLFHALVSEPSAPWSQLVAAAHYWAGLCIGVSVLFGFVGLVRRAA